jgi:Rrf2 family transcriptional regulator, nitric oxide-sensitive transcriptional repressor
MFSQTVEYALRAVTHLAITPDRVHPTSEIAEATKVPLPYLSKVLQSLQRQKIVIVKRGLHGGYSILKPPQELTLYEVVQAVDPIQRITTCPLELASHGKRLCSLHKKLDQAMADMEQAFRTTSLHELVTHPGPSKPLCDESKKRPSKRRVS